MDTRIVVSLPVKSVSKSVEFFSKLGFSFDAQRTNETAACLIMDRDILVMLVTEDEPRTCAARPIYDAARSPQAQMAIS